MILLNAWEGGRRKAEYLIFESSSPVSEPDESILWHFGLGPFVLRSIKDGRGKTLGLANVGYAVQGLSITSQIVISALKEQA